MPSLFLLCALASAPAAAAPTDSTEAALKRCLEDAANASTAGQTGCEAKAAHAYDRRMNVAYAALMKALPSSAALRLRDAQRAWLAFRSADSRARSALFATRQGTMYVPMQAAAEVEVLRARTLQLETQLRILRIDE